jgi:hypothetical protein
VGTVLLFVVAIPAFAQQQPEAECARTSGMRVYSNATYVEEAGDVVAIELALSVRSDTSVTAFLYDYEGVPTTSFALLGHLSGKTLTIEGSWIQNLRDSSSKEVVRTVPVNVRGELDEKAFEGSVQIDAGKAQTVRLRPVDAIWFCRANSEVTANPRR